jgi:hypothetical protein
MLTFTRELCTLNHFGRGRQRSFLLRKCRAVYKNTHVEAREYDFILYNVLSLRNWRITNKYLHNQTNCDISRCKFHLNAQAKKFNTPEWNSEGRFCKQLCQHDVNFSTYTTTQNRYTEVGRESISTQRVLLCERAQGTEGFTLATA